MAGVAFTSPKQEEASSPSQVPAPQQGGSAAKSYQNFDDEVGGWTLALSSPEVWSWTHPWRGSY